MAGEAIALLSGWAVEVALATWGALSVCAYKAQRAVERVVASFGGIYSCWGAVLKKEALARRFEIKAARCCAAHKERAAEEDVYVAVRALDGRSL